MKVTFTNDKPTSVKMSSDEVHSILIDHIDRVLQQRCCQSAKVDVGSAYFNCGYGFAGEITTNPDVSTITEIEL